jgi:glycosyltransferase involved in cell wall biosynthesis
MTETVAVCIPTIPPRRHMLREAINSVLDQERQPDELIVVSDANGDGAGPTRNRAWRRASADWIAFLDDDDKLYPQHLGTLLAHSADVDLVYPWFDLPRGTDPLFTHVNGQLAPAYGVPFGDEQREYVLTRGNFIPVTVLVRRAYLEKVDGFPTPRSERWPHTECEDWGCWQDLLRAGARFHHVPDRTWVWNWHGRNTSGKSWKA